MKTYCEIYDNKVHRIFESEEKPEFASYIIIIDITGNELVQEGWNYNPNTEVFTAPIILPVVPVIKQPTNADLKAMLITVMMAINDVYAQLPTPPA